MKILLIILSVIGLLKVVSLFILCIVELLYARDEKVPGISKEYGIYRVDDFYVIPTIRFTKSGKYFEIMAYWLCFEYYSSYYVDREENESSSV